MSSRIYEFMRNRYNAFVLPLASERCVPGMLLETRWGFSLPVDSKPDFIREDGYFWDIAGIPKKTYGSEVKKANIIQESINDKFDLGVSASLPQYGLTFSGDLNTEYQVQIKITGIHARVFKNSGAPFTAMQALLDLKSGKPKAWDWVNDDFLITESYHVQSFIATFRGSTGVSVKAAFQNAGFKVDGGLTAKWSGNSTLELVGTQEVPLAVRGIKV